MASSVTFVGELDRVSLGPRVTVKGPTVLSVEDGGGLRGARLEVGSGTFIGELNNLRCGGAPIHIGRDCLISQQVTIVGSNHLIAPGQLVGEQDWVGEGVVIGAGVWIGAGSVLLPGARVGDGAVVAAATVVRGVVADDCVVGGNPMRVLGHRS